MQIMEWELSFRSNNGRGESLSALQEWARLYNLALGATGHPEGKKSVSVAQDCGAWLRTARFEGVQTAFKEVPTCAWSTGTKFRGGVSFQLLTGLPDARWRDIGNTNHAIMEGLIESLAIYPVVARGVSTLEDFQQLCIRAKEELTNVDAEPFVRL